MKIVLDTSALVRFFTRDIEKKAQKVKKLLESDTDIFIPDVVFSELEYILIKKYGLPRSKVIESYHFLITQENIKKSIYIKKAVEIYQKTKLDMADCIIAAQSMGGSLASFDKKLLKAPKVKPFWRNF